MTFGIKHLAGILTAASLLAFTAVQAAADDPVYTDETGDKFTYTQDASRIYLTFTEDNGDGIVTVPKTINGNNISVFLSEASFTTLNAKDCSNLIGINITGNGVKDLILDGCTGLEQFTCSYNRQIGKLDLSGFKKLYSLTCVNDDLTAINIDGCSALRYLDLHFNDISELDVSGCPDLIELNCNYNAISAIDLRKNPSLKKFAGSHSNLGSIDLSNNSELTELNLAGTFIRKVDLSNNKKLKKLDLSHIPLGKIDLKDHIGITYLNLSNTGLTELDLSTLKDLQSLDVSYNSLACLDMSNNTKVTTFTCKQNSRPVTCTDNTFKLSDLPGFDLSKASNWENGTVNNGILTFSQDKVTYDYDCGNGRSAKFELQKGTSFNGDIFGYEIIGSKCSIISVKDNGDGHVTIPEKIEGAVVTSVNCSGSSLTSIDTGSCPSLVSLTCSGNDLTKLDLKNNKALEALNCGNNDLTELDISCCGKLRNIVCSQNDLTKLDLSSNSSLEYLDCHNNKLESLDVSANKKLFYLKCTHNQLTSLVTGENDKLKNIFCSVNKLKSLDISGNPGLLLVSAFYNDIKYLNIYGIEYLVDNYKNGDRASGEYIVYFTKSGESFLLLDLDTVVDPDKPTPSPTATTTPEPTDTPENTTVPDPTATPENTTVPEPTSIPENTTVPGTGTPVPTVLPGTGTPAPTATPAGLTPAPVLSVTPVISTVPASTAIKTKDAEYKTTGSDEVIFVAPLDKNAASITIPSAITVDDRSYKVTEIAAGALKSKKKLTTLIIGDNVRKIGKKAFYGCPDLKKVTIGKGLISMGDSAFAKCPKLKTFKIKSKKVTKLGKNFLKGDKSLKAITLKSTKLTKKSIKNSLKGSSVKTVKVPKSKFKSYKTIFTKKICGRKVTLKR